MPASAGKSRVKRTIAELTPSEEQIIPLLADDIGANNSRSIELPFHYYLFLLLSLISICSVGAKKKRLESLILPLRGSQSRHRHHYH